MGFQGLRPWWGPGAKPLAFLPPSGFTLVEVLVSLVVLGFLLAGLAQATNFGIRAWGVETRLEDSAAERERVERVLRNLITASRPPMAADDKPFAGQEHRLIFLTTLPDQPPTQPIRRAQVALGVDDQHRLVLRWQPQPNAVALKPVPAAEEIVLARGIERLDVTYRGAASDGGKWGRSWADSPLPALVQLHLVPTTGGARWPDIQVAPMIDTNGSF